MHEEGLREGFQIEPEPIPTADKIRLIGALSQNGRASVRIAHWSIGGCYRLWSCCRTPSP
jgi:hypothetical protein